MWKRFSSNGGSETASRGLRASDNLTAAVLATPAGRATPVSGRACQGRRARRDVIRSINERRVRVGLVDWHGPDVRPGATYEH